MLIDARSSWDRLSVELDLLNTEDPSSLLQMMVGLNGLVWPLESMEWTARTINFMTYEIMARTEGLSEAERLQILNEEFFEKRGFSISPAGGSKPEHLLIKPVTEQREGHPLAICLLYLHLTSHLDLPAFLVQLKNQYLLKWVRGGRVNYIDLMTQGRVLTEAELIAIIQTQSNGDSLRTADPMAIQSSRKLFGQYAGAVASAFESAGEESPLHLVYNVLLKIDPQDLNYLGRRALLRQKLGLQKDALIDLKQFFSFVDHKAAPPELRAALAGLQNHTLH